MKIEDFVRKFDLNGLLEYAKSLNLPKNSHEFDYSFVVFKKIAELKIEINHYASLYRSTLELKKVIEGKITDWRYKYKRSSWYNGWFFKIMIEKQADKLLESYGLLHFYEDKLVNKVKRLEEFLEIQNK